jgi:hypothetical protein
MGRTIRMVPGDWKHPVNDHGYFIPLLDGPFSKRLAEWELGNEKWSQGFSDDYSGGWRKKDEKYKSMSFEEWNGKKPIPEDYMPEWKPEEKTHLMMYEDTTEGTPISPSFATPEELAKWLFDNKASSFGDRTASYEEWLAVCKSGWAPSAVISKNGLVSGVEFIGGE